MVEEKRLGNVLRHGDTYRFVRVVAIVVVLCSVTALPSAVAEVRTAITIDAYNTVTIDSKDTTAAGIAQGEIDFQSSGNSDVRSRLQLRTFLANVDGEQLGVVRVPRAEIRWRMYAGEDYRIRFTAGRSRLTWGDGVLYNAADTINGAEPDAFDLSSDILRDETQWLVAGYFPLGRFAFFEPVALVPGFSLDQTVLDTTVASGSSTESSDVGDDGPFSGVTPDPAWHTGGGGRLQLKIGEIKTEVGYLYRGEEEIHQPSLSLQGNLVLDWYVGGSLRLPEYPDKEMFLSGGLLYNGNTRRLGSWSVRAETLWNQSAERLSVYPEVTWSPSQLFSTFLRSTVHPVEDAKWVAGNLLESANTIGVRWLPATGLTISLFTTIATTRGVDVDPDQTTKEEPTDLSSSITAAVSYTF